MTIRSNFKRLKDTYWRDIIIVCLIDSFKKRYYHDDACLRFNPSLTLILGLAVVDVETYVHAFVTPTSLPVRTCI